MNVFDAWLIIVGLAIGAGLTWLVMVDLRRHDDDLAARELPAEAAWIADMLRRAEIAADPEAVEEVLRLHRSYLAGIPDERGVPLPATVDDPDPDGYLEHPRRVDVEPRADEARTADAGPPPRSPATVAPAVAATRPDPEPAAPEPEPDAEPEPELEPEPEILDEEGQAAHDALDALLNRPRPAD